MQHGVTEQKTAIFKSYFIKGQKIFKPHSKIWSVS